MSNGTPRRGRPPIRFAEGFPTICRTANNSGKVRRRLVGNPVQVCTMEDAWAEDAAEAEEAHSILLVRVGGVPRSFITNLVEKTLLTSYKARKSQLVVSAQQ